MIDLRGQVAMITGASSGIGRATALLLGSLGAKIAVTDLYAKTRESNQLVSELSGQGVQAMALSIDVRDLTAIENNVRLIRQRFGSIDILVNNAGTQRLKPALEIDEDELDDVISVNLKGPFFCAQAVAAVMIENNGGCIVNVASQHGVVGNVLRAAYCASKGGLVNLTRALAVEWARYKIRVNSISPTFVMNDQNRTLLESPEYQAEIAQNIPLGMSALPNDVAQGICYLVSPAARMVTGHNLLVDGGWTAR